MRALILSAGFGERLRPLTSARAKPALEFLNIPMLGFPYYWLKTLRLNELVLNTHHLPDSIRHAAMHVADPAIPLRFSHEDQILGSGGGIQHARVFLDSDADFMVANGDGVVLFEEHDTLEQMVAFHKRKKALATFLVCPLEGVGTRLPGVWMDNGGEVVGFGKTSPKNYAECYHYASYMVLSKRIWRHMPDGSSNILYDVIAPLLNDGEKVYGFKVDGMRWFETGNPAEYLNATQECLRLMSVPGRLGDSIRKIVAELSPSYGLHSDLPGLRLIADSAQIDPRASLSGFCVVGSNCRIEAGAHLENAVLLPQAKLAAEESCINQIRI